jgi:hypothetical protein
MTGYEAETIIIYNEVEDILEFYTASIKINKLLAKRGFEPYKTVNDIKGKPSGWHYKFPKYAILIKPENKVIRVGGRRKVKAAASSGMATAQIG